MKLHGIFFSDKLPAMEAENIFFVKAPQTDGFSGMQRKCIMVYSIVAALFAASIFSGALPAYFYGFALYRV